MAELKEKYGDQITLIGNVDVSQVLPLGTTEGASLPKSSVVWIVPKREVDIF